MRIKYVLAFFLVLIAATVSARVTVMVIGGGEADPCVTAGCTGTYAACWTGEYPSDTDKMCLNSGASTQDATGQVAGTIHGDGAINGSYGVILDTDDEYVYWATTSASLDEEGTFSVQLATGGTLSDTGLAHAYASTATSSNHLTLYTAGTGTDAKGWYEGNGTSQEIQGSGSQISASSTYTVCYTWKLSTDDHCVCVTTAGDNDCSGCSWDCAVGANLIQFAQDTAFVQLGLDCGDGGGDGDCNKESFTETVKIDDFYIFSDYKGT